MFSLITTILSIVLVGILGFATMYFMGDTTDEALREAQVATLVNSASQIQGALEMRTSDYPGGTLSSVDQLVPQYLNSVPEGEWRLNADGVVSTLDTEEQCEAFNAKLGYGAVAPTCDDPEYSKKTSCCLSDI